MFRLTVSYKDININFNNWFSSAIAFFTIIFVLECTYYKNSYKVITSQTYSINLPSMLITYFETKQPTIS